MKALGTNGRWSSNVERDFHKLAKDVLGTNYELYGVKTVFKDSLKASRDVFIDVLLPHEMCLVLRRPRLTQQLMSVWRQ